MGERVMELREREAHRPVGADPIQGVLPLNIGKGVPRLASVWEKITPNSSPPSRATRSFSRWRWRASSLATWMRQVSP